MVSTSASGVLQRKTPRPAKRGAEMKPARPPMPEDVRTDLITIGTIVRPQGRKGEVVVEPLSDRPDRFPSLRQAWVADAQGRARPAGVTSCWPHKGRFVVKLEGIDSIDEAETLRGQDLRISEDELAPLPAGSYYHYQLTGLSVQDPAGRDLGRVFGVMESGEGVPGVPILVVRGAGPERLIPLAADFVTRVDLAHGVLVATAPEVDPA
jgi:16S rRNA processing protein RimM